jgi:hypothetical protein
MKTHRWNTWGLLLIALALQGNNLHNWHEAVTPQFVFGCLAAIGAVLKAMVQD